MNSAKTTTLIGLAIVLIIIAGLIFALFDNTKRQELYAIQSFDDCAKAGYPILETYPEQCVAPDGRTFVNPEQRVATSTGEEPSAAKGECVKAGCSNQLCLSAEEAKNVVTTCEYRAEYACYKNATCEKQANGKCGWTQSAALKNCLAHPPVQTMPEPVY